MKKSILVPNFFFLLLLSSLWRLVHTVNGNATVSPSAPNNNNQEGKLDDGVIVAIFFGALTVIVSCLGSSWRFCYRKKAIDKRLRAYPFMHSIVKDLDLTRSEFNSFDSEQGATLLNFIENLLNQFEYRDSTAAEGTKFGDYIKKHQRDFIRMPEAKAARSAIVNAIKNCSSIQLTKHSLWCCNDGYYLSINQLQLSEAWIKEAVSSALDQFENLQPISEPESASIQSLAEDTKPTTPLTTRPTATLEENSRTVVGTHVNGTINMGDFYGSAKEQATYEKMIHERKKTETNSETETETEENPINNHDIVAKPNARFLAGGKVKKTGRVDMGDRHFTGSSEIPVSNPKK